MHPDYYTDTEMSKLFIGNLSFDTTDESLSREISKFGKIEECFVLSKRDDLYKSGYAFCTLSSLDDAQKVIDAMNGATFEGNRLYIDFAQEIKRDREAESYGNINFTSEF